MLARLGRAAALAGLLVLPDPAWAADAPASEEGQALDVRRLAPEQRRRLLAGDTIAYQVAETSETELGAGVAMYVAVPLSRAAEVLTSADVVLKDPSITASGHIPAGATVAALHGFKLSSGEIGEAQDALDVAAGSRFNMTLPEINLFRAAKGTVRPNDRAALLDAATGQWRTLLLERAQAFQTRGLDGVAPYARRSGTSEPAALLRVAAGDARIVSSLAPRLGEALLRYPADQSPTASSQVYWVKRQVQGAAHSDPAPPPRGRDPGARALRGAAVLRGPHVQREPDPLRRGALRGRRADPLEQPRVHRPGGGPRRRAEAHDRAAAAPRRDRQALRPHPRRAGAADRAARAGGEPVA